MFPSVYGGKPEWMAMTPHIPAARHVLPPSILGNNSSPIPKPHSRQTAPETSARMDGSTAESASIMKSTLR